MQRIRPIRWHERRNMDEISQLLSDQKMLEQKKLAQIISFIGDGKLKNGNDSFRRFLKNIPNNFLVKYAEECLEKTFPDSGLALQDVVNEIGARLGFKITSGLYRGNKNDIGFDGIWEQYDTWSLVVEVKTTDAYRIPLETIATYRNRLIESGKVNKAKSSMLIVVGRDDTGELEAQIRGSKHAWDIRIISIDSLIRLLRIKESLSDESTAQKISIALRPYEFTRVDQLIELLFLAIKDVEVEEIANEFIEEEDSSSHPVDKKVKEKVAPVSFREPVFNKIREKLKANFIKQSKSSYSSTDGKIGIIISISKQHPPFNSQFDARYWFAFHPHQESFLSKYYESYACYGCGEEKNVFMMPLSFMKSKLNDMWKTKNGERDYKHIVIYRKNDKFYLRTNINDKEHYDDLSEFAI
jgi:hypothetical protein